MNRIYNPKIPNDREMRKEMEQFEIVLTLVKRNSAEGGTKRLKDMLMSGEQRLLGGTTSNEQISIQQSIGNNISKSQILVLLTFRQSITEHLTSTKIPTKRSRCYENVENPSKWQKYQSRAVRIFRNDGNSGQNMMKIKITQSAS